MLWQQSKSNPRACEAHPKPFDVVWHKFSLKDYECGSEQRDGQWRLVQDCHLCSGISSTPAVCRGQCPWLLQWWQCPAQTAYHDFLVLANRMCHCSAAYYLPREKALKNSTQLEHTQRILEGVKGFFPLEMYMEKTEGKVLDSSVIIQEFCGHNFRLQKGRCQRS